MQPGEAPQEGAPGLTQEYMYVWPKAKAGTMAAPCCMAIRTKPARGAGGTRRCLPELLQRLLDAKRLAGATESWMCSLQRRRYLCGVSGTPPPPRAACADTPAKRHGAGASTLQSTMSGPWHTGPCICMHAWPTVHWQHGTMHVHTAAEGVGTHAAAPARRRGTARRSRQRPGWSS